MRDRRRRFVQEYLIDMNGTQAAIRAGYARSGAHTEANRLLAAPEVRVMVAEGQKALQERTEVTQEYVVRNLKEVAERCIELGEFTAATRALELLGKHIGMFKDGPTMLIQNNVSNNEVHTITRRIIDPQEEP